MRRLLSVCRALILSRRPVTLVVWGYALYILVGFGLLCLPWAHARPHVGMLDSLFVATSAVSTTGLSTIGVADSYNFFGELVIAALIQLGGIGYMTLGSFVMLALRQRLDSLHSNVAQQTFALPRGADVAQFIRGVVIFTVVIETIGAAVLAHAFAADGVPAPLWNGIFHSISAFCTAGFSLFSNGLEGFRDDVTVNLTIAVLSYLGAIGFIVMSDGWRWLVLGRRRVSLTSRLILRVTVVLTVIGTLALFLTDSTLDQLPPGERLLASFFQVMTAMTTVGFDTVPINTLGHASIMLLIVAMIMGASPSGTGGGIKSTTVAVFYGAVRAALAGRTEIILLGRSIQPRRLTMAVAAVGMYIGCLVVGIFALLLVDGHALLPLMFEAASAIGTVGLSLGVTAGLSEAGKCVVIALMFLGRLGPMTAGL
ncbi:TrkH family potassium uptake protein, partial [Salinisphaera hydrothermalis]|uniref:TrkH family potassium uptake protein n=1 Tax=Salinisphaera hydrothermalis TaxID=563188 RepID=UPI0033405025